MRLACARPMSETCAGAFAMLPAVCVALVGLLVNPLDGSSRCLPCGRTAVAFERGEGLGAEKELTL